MELIIKLILCYLLGSVSGSMLMGKLKGIDIRKMGSGNAGATNAFRTMGSSFALRVLIIDILKGFIAVEFVTSLKLGGILTTNIMNIELLPHVLCGISVVMGHIFPLYFGFKGGKGVGTIVGVLIALFPTSLLICLPIWLVVLIFSGYVGLSTIIVGIAFPICTLIFYTKGIYSPFGFFSLMVPVLFIYTHRLNISRMIAGKENRFERIMVFRRNNN